jgi:hypothetical protein
LHGKWENNVERDMTRWLHHLYGFTVESYKLKLTLQHQAWLEPVTLEMAVIPPYEMSVCSK